MVLQSYAGYMVDCTTEMVQSLRNEVEKGQTEFEIGEYMTRLTADIISRTEFDTNYEKGKQIFHLLTVLQHLCAKSTRHLCFPGSRLIHSPITKSTQLFYSSNKLTDLQICTKQVQQRNKVTENRGGEAVNGDHTESERLRGNRSKHLARQRFTGNAAQRNAEEEIWEWLQLESSSHNGRMQNLLLRRPRYDGAFAYVDDYAACQQPLLARQSSR